MIVQADEWERTQLAAEGTGSHQPGGGVEYVKKTKKMFVTFKKRKKRKRSNNPKKPPDKG